MLFGDKTAAVLIIVGIALGIIGYLSPWGRHIPNMFDPGQNVEVGTNFTSGHYTLYAFLAVIMFQLIFMFMRKVFMIFAVLISGLVALFISGNWILQPVRSLGSTYTVLYGAYVTLVGAVIVSAVAFLYIAVTAENQLSLSSLKEGTRILQIDLREKDCFLQQTLALYSK